MKIRTLIVDDEPHAIEIIRKYAEQIRASGKFRNDNAERDNTWQPTGRGFKFFRAKDGVFYNIEVDTVSGLVRYNELG